MNKLYRPSGLICVVLIISLWRCSGLLAEERDLQTNEIPQIQIDADKGSASAQYDLGRAYSRGIGFKTNFVEALKWYRKAADQGEARAQYKMGLAYEEGYAVRQDNVEAIGWYRKSAQNGYAAAQVRLGRMYQNGRGVAKDQKEAVHWLVMAAEQGDADGQMQIGFIFDELKGYEQAAKWFRKAAEQGNAQAQLLMGIYYSEGTGVEKDNIEAVKWFNLAADQRQSMAGTQRQMLFKKMTRDQIVEGHKRAIAFTNAFRERKTESKQASSGISLEKPKSGGSGFLITEDGYLVTNFHVLEGAERIVARINGTNYPARTVKTDMANDIAVLKVSGSFKPVPIMPSRGVSLGDAVFTIGFPNTQMQGIEPKLTDGKISSLAGLRDDARHFQVSVPIQPGNSGGALINSAGNVVGIINSKLSDIAMLRATGSLPQNVNYAIKGSYALSFLEAIPEVQGQLKNPWTEKNRPFETVVKEMQAAAAMILVY